MVVPDNRLSVGGRNDAGLIEEDTDRMGVAGRNCGKTGVSGGRDDRGALLEDDGVITDDDAAPKATASAEHPERSYASGEEAGGADCGRN